MLQGFQPAGVESVGTCELEGYVTRFPACVVPVARRCQPSIHQQVGNLVA